MVPVVKKSNLQNVRMQLPIKMAPGIKNVRENGPSQI